MIPRNGENRNHVTRCLIGTSSEPSNPSGCKHAPVHQGVVTCRCWAGRGEPSGDMAVHARPGGKGGVTTSWWTGQQPGQVMEQKWAAAGEHEYLWPKLQQTKVCACAFILRGQMQREHLLVSCFNVLLKYQKKRQDHKLWGEISHPLPLPSSRNSNLSSMQGAGTYPGYTQEDYPAFLVLVQSVPECGIILIVTGITCESQSHVGFTSGHSEAAGNISLVGPASTSGVRMTLQFCHSPVYRFVDRTASPPQSPTPTTLVVCCCVTDQPKTWLKNKEYLLFLSISVCEASGERIGWLEVNHEVAFKMSVRPTVL